MRGGTARVTRGGGLKTRERGKVPDLGGEVGALGGSNLCDDAAAEVRLPYSTVRYRVNENFDNLPLLANLTKYHAWWKQK